MNGLDSSDRELGVFGSLGLIVFNLIHLLPIYYRKLSNEQLTQINAKYLFNGELLPEELLSKVGQ